MTANRAIAQLAAKAGASQNDVTNMTIWGNHSATQYPDLFHATVNGVPGFEAVGSADESALLEKQTVLWAGRGRRIIGLHVSKQICTPAQAEALLQKVIDAVP